MRDLKFESEQVRDNAAEILESRPKWEMIHQVEWVDTEDAILNK